MELSAETEKRICLLFPPDEQELVRTVLVDFGSELFGYGRSKREVERVWFAVLKLSDGKLDGVDRALALRDYRGEPSVYMNWLPEKAW
jgi:hypothetical protein